MYRAPLPLFILSSIDRYIDEKAVEMSVYCVDIFNACCIYLSVCDCDGIKIYEKTIMSITRTTLSSSLNNNNSNKPPLLNLTNNNCNNNNNNVKYNSTLIEKREDDDNDVTNNANNERKTVIATRKSCNNINNSEMTMEYSTYNNYYNNDSNGIDNQQLTVEKKRQSNKLNMKASAYEEMNSSRRNTMEDCYVIHEPGTWQAPDPDLAYLAVYDGHGGRDMVDYLEHGLSYHVATELAVNDGAGMETKLERAFLMADIHSLHSGVTTSGATVVLCLVKKLIQTNQIKIYTANVGDARAVAGIRKKRRVEEEKVIPELEERDQKNASRSSSKHDDYYGQTCNSSSTTKPVISTTTTSNTTTTQSSSNTTVVRLSMDHRTDDPQEVQRIEQSGGFLFKGRVLGVLAVTRSLGDQCMKEYVIAKPYFNEITIDLPFGDHDSSSSSIQQQQQQYQVLIVACDGLWDVIQDQEAIDLVFDFCHRNNQQNNNKNNTSRNVAEYLTQEALKRGSTDNVTIIVVWLS